MESETSISKQWFDMVEIFHNKFGHPISGPRGSILSEPRRVARASWLIEELLEFVKAEDITDQVDACLDFLYFCFGNFVELGILPEGLDCEFYSEEERPTDMKFSHRVSFASRATEDVYKFMKSDTLRGQRDFSTDSARVMLRCLAVMKVNPVGLMEILQQSNMSKLWADGKPRCRPSDGKIIKPNTWEPPNKELGKELERRASKWIEDHKDDEIPF